MAQRTTFIGRYAECSVGGVVVANLFDWEVTLEGDYEDVTAHGDEWEVVVPLKQRWTARARGYILTGAASYMTAFNAAGEPAAMVFRGFLGPASGGVLRFHATGYPTRVNFSVPMELIEQEVEIRGTSFPTFIG